MKIVDALTKAKGVSQEIAIDPRYRVRLDAHRHVEGHRGNSDIVQLVPGRFEPYIARLKTLEKKKELVENQVDGGSKESSGDIFEEGIRTTLSEAYAEGARFVNLLFCPGAYCINEGDLGLVKVYERLAIITDLDDNQLYSEWTKTLLSARKTGVGEETFGLTFSEVVRMFSERLAKVVREFPGLKVSLTLSLRKDKDRHILLQEQLKNPFNRNDQIAPISPQEIINLYKQGLFTDLDFSGNETVLSYDDDKFTAFINELSSDIPMQAHMGEPSYKERGVPYRNINWLLRRRNEFGFNFHKITHAVRFFDGYTINKGGHRIFSYRDTNLNPVWLTLSPESNYLTGAVPKQYHHMVINKLVSNDRNLRDPKINRNFIGSLENFRLLIGTDNPVNSYGENPLLHVYIETLTIVALLHQQGKSIVTPEEFAIVLMGNQERYITQMQLDKGRIFSSELEDENALSTFDPQRTQDAQIITFDRVERGFTDDPFEVQPAAV